MSFDGEVEVACKTSYFIGKKENVIKAKRVVNSFAGKDILVIYHQGDFYAIDARCYRKFMCSVADSGGPLQNGDIEDFDGRPCIVCPWHKYKITLSEGEGLYQAVDPSVKPMKPTWCSKGIKQRVHTVTESNGDLFLTLNDSSESFESDYYQTEKYRKTLLKT
ncbi:hypothetical protein DNTS_023678 [Danionella cerebrum]|uniref:Rieske domain-containing protein n=1 Tax=Danionella cerebrum TaxID=2873325 RepID=A0A553MMJ7_9TELE|nr:hypothetical protein DNTS_023678 [Danionella translucida]